MTLVFAKRLRELRLEKQLSQKEAAKALDVSQALLSHYEKGIRECGLSFVVKVSDFYDVSCDYLLGKTNEKQFIGDILTSKELPTDGEPTFGTLMHTLYCMLERTAQRFDVAIHETRLFQYYMLHTYNCLLLSDESNYLLNKQFSLNPKFANIATEGLIAKLKREMFATDKLDNWEDGVPLCMQTVITEMETYILTIEEAAFSSSK